MAKNNCETLTNKHLEILRKNGISVGEGKKYSKLQANSAFTQLGENSEFNIPENTDEFEAFIVKNKQRIIDALDEIKLNKIEQDKKIKELKESENYIEIELDNTADQDNNQNKFTWATTDKNSFEVSTAAKENGVIGDARFSAFNAKFKSGTIIDGVDVGGKSIEYVYQTIIKKSGKGRPPAKNSKLYNESLKTKEEKENFSYTEGYLLLWKEWARQNPQLIEELRTAAQGKTLTDKFSENTTVNQARALTDILNEELVKTANIKIPLKIVNGKEWNKSAPRTNPDTLFIFGENLQAYNALSDNPIKIKGLLSVKNIAKLLNVGGSNAIIRMIDDTTPNKNAFGLVVKKNAQDEDGNWIEEPGFFTEEDEKEFLEINRQVIKNIKEALKSGKYKKVSIAGQLALNHAGLPKKLAGGLAKLLQEELGLVTSIDESGVKGASKTYYGIKILNGQSAKSKKSNKESKKEKKKKEELAEAIESLNAVRPIIDQINQEIDNRNLLAKIFPNIEKRAARVSFVTNRFSEILTYEIENIKKTYQDSEYLDSLEEDDKQEVLFRLEKLTSGTEAEQRVFALGNIMMNDGDTQISLGEYIFKQIKKQMQTVVAVVNNPNEKVAKQQILEVLSDPNNYEGYEFLTKAMDYGWAQYIEESNKIVLNSTGEKQAYSHALNLASAFSVILSTPNVYEALVNEAATELEFNENIRLTIDKKSVVETAKDLENIDEEGKVDDRSGLNLIKYKLMDPAKSLSVRMKTMLSRLYKTNPNSGEYTNSVQFVYNDLGYRQRINAGYAYYVLLNEFSEMRGPQDLMTIMDKAVEKYAWMNEIRNQILENEDLRNEFFRSMNRVFSPAAMILQTGELKRLNRVITQEAFLNEVQKNYEGHIILGDHSIYNEDGECEADNVERLFRLVAFGSDKTNLSDEDTKKKHPIAWARKILGSKKTKHYTIENLKEAINILNGVSETVGKEGSLDLLLRNLGINTSDLNLAILVPAWENIEARMEELRVDNPELDNLSLFELAYPQENRTSLLDLIGEGVYYIVEQSKNNDKGFREGQHLTDAFNTAYSNIARNLTITSNGYDQASYKFNGKQRYSYCPPDFISKLINNIQGKNMTEEEVREYIIQNYLKYDFYQTISLNSLVSEQVSESMYKQLSWLERFFLDENLRKHFVYYNILGIGNKGQREENTIQNVSDEQFLEGLILGFFNAKSDSQGNNYGLYRASLFSDTDALILFQAPREVTDSNGDFKSKIITRLSKVLEQEINRILDSSEEKGTVVEHYNDKRNNSSKFCFFPQLNAKKDEIIEHYSNSKSVQEAEAYLKQLAADILEQQCQDFINSIDEGSRHQLYDKITKLNQNKEEESSEDTNETEDSEEDSQEEQNAEEVEKEVSDRQKELEINMLEQFYYNDYYAQTQIIQLLGGDLAQFKNFQDFIKRNKQSYVAGERIWSLDEDGNEMNDVAMYAEDLECVANTYEQIGILLNSSKDLSEIDKAFIKGALAKFGNITSTDGQSFRTIKSFRKILKAMGGKWTEDMERSYNNIIQNKRLTMEDFTNLWNQLKPFVYTHEDRIVNGRLEKVNIQYKNSEYMLSALYGILNTALNQSPQLVGLHRFMDDHDIDVCHFHSSVKIGFNNPFDINYKNGKASYDRINEAKKKLENGEINQEQFNNIVSEESFKTDDEVYEALNQQLNEKQIKYATSYKEELNNTNRGTNINQAFSPFHITPLSDYMVVQPSDNHLTDAEAIFGSQLRNIIPADLDEDFTLTININDKQVTLNREQAVLYYNVVIMDQLIDAFSALDKKFSNPKTLSSYLQDMMKNNPKYGDDVKLALQLNEDGTGFRMPFNSPNLSNKINELILSAFKNNIQRQKVKGGNAVLVSNFGLSDKLHIKYKNDNPEEGIEYIPAYMPFYMKSMLEDYLEGDDINGYSINFEKAKGNIDKELLDVIGYRIPTENKYSIMPIKIVGFLPNSCGTSVMLPNEIITMSGTDFDIDKLFFMFRECRRVKAGNKLATEYLNWLERNKKIVKDKTLNTFTDYTEYTHDQILTLYNKDADFQQFWEEEGYNYLYEKPKYRVLRPKYKLNQDGTLNISETSKLEGVSAKDRKALRNNMLIDVIWGVMTSPSGSRLSMNPGAYDNVSNGSEIQNILNDTEVLKKFMVKYKKDIDKYGIWRVLNSLSTKDLEQFYEENSTSGNDPNSIQSYILNHRNLMDGNALIGAFAINSSSHYKYQFLNLTINELNQFSIRPLGAKKAVKITEVDPVKSPIDNNLIGRICAEYQAAAPDNGKDPRLGKLGVNLNNASLVYFLSRIGIDPQTTGVLLKGGLDLESYGAEAQDTLKLDEQKVLDNFSGDIEEIVSNIVAFKFKKDDVSAEFAAQYYIWMKNIRILAGALNNSSAISKVDSPNAALAVDAAEAIQQRLKAEDFIKEASSLAYPIQGFTNFIDINMDPYEYSENPEAFREKLINSAIPRMSAFYSLGITGALTMAGKWLTCLQGNTVEAVRYLRNQIRQPMTYQGDLAELKKFYSELNTFLLSMNSIFASDKEGKTMLDKRNYYIHDFPMKLYTFLEEKDKKGNYVHKEVRNLTFIKRLSNASEKGITMKETSVKTSPQSRKHYNEEIESLMFMDAATQELAMDLILYSYYDSGLNFGHSNVANYITTLMMEKVPRFIDSLKDNTTRWENDSTMIKQFVRLFLLNHYDLIPLIRTNKSSIKRSDDGQVITITDKKLKNQLRTGVNKDGLSYIDLIRDRKYVYERVKSYTNGKENTDQLVYRVISYNKTYAKASLYTPFYGVDENNEPQFTDMKSKGRIMNINSKKNKDRIKSLNEEGGNTSGIDKLNKEDGGTNEADKLKDEQNMVMPIKDDNGADIADALNDDYTSKTNAQTDIQQDPQGIHLKDGEESSTFINGLGNDISDVNVLNTDGPMNQNVDKNIEKMKGTKQNPLCVPK